MESLSYNGKVCIIQRASWELLILLFSISFELVCYRTYPKKIMPYSKEYFQSIKSSICFSGF